MFRALLSLALLVSIASTGFGCASQQAVGATSIFPAGTVERMSHGVFEVVVPQVDDGAVKYAEPLPVDLLPFAQRNDRFVGIGTAFAIGPNNFVTAAHVLKAYEAIPHERYLLRDAAGATYEIARIVRYSQYRDLVELELDKAPAGVVPLEMRAKVDIGEVVNTVGNAGGEGIVIRSGSITSFTPEPVDGKWRYIRFTAPASPGNSGGPLVDGAGRVIGVVVQKSAAENLNLAVPIEEVEKLSPTRSEFLIKGITIGEGTQRELVEWRFSSPLPAPFAQLHAAAERDLADFVTAKVTASDAKNAAQSFPDDPRLQPLLHAPTSVAGLGTFVRDGNGQWTVAENRYQKRTTAGGDEVRVAEAADRRSGEVLFDKPKAMTAAYFFKHPTIVADFLARTDGWAVVFAGRAIPIAAMGPPVDDEHWMDVYGRPWSTFVWRVDRSGESVVLQCLTRPSGWACHWRKVPRAQEDLVRREARRLAPRATLNYTGTVGEWEQYLALPRSARPRVLEHVKVSAVAKTADGLSLALVMGPLAGTIDLAGLTRKSRITTLVSVDPAALGTERIYSARVDPAGEGDAVFGVDEVLEPIASSSAKHASVWSKIGNRTSPYDGNAAPDGKVQMAAGLLQPGAAPSGKRVIYFCRAPSTDPKAALETSCAEFRAAVKSPVPASLNDPY